MLKILALIPILFFALTTFSLSAEETPDQATVTFAVS